MSETPDPAPERQAAIVHCVATIARIVERGQSDSRLLLQLGYNLGRLSELTNQGRGPFWDAWKEPAVRWDVETLRRLSNQLNQWLEHDAGPPPRST